MRPVARALRGVAVAALGAAVAVAPAPAAAQTPAPDPTPPRSGLDLPVREVVLDNGMRFLLLPRPGAPTVAFVMEYAVGGVDELPGTTGIAHLLEHLLFKGTTAIGTTDPAAERVWFERMDAVHDSVRAERSSPAPDTGRIQAWTARIDALEDSARTVAVPDEFDRILSRNGARGLNASTTAEATTYQVELPAHRAELWFALEAERMRAPVFRDFHAERGVVMEERRMRVETSPGGLLHEALLAHAFTIHPYGQPVVGTAADLAAITRAEVERHHRRYYGPHNATVAIVGDLDPEQMAGWAEAYFGPLPAGEPPPPVTTREPEQRGRRDIRIDFDAEPSALLGWRIPSIHHDDAPALAVLATLLTGGRSSRLYRRLVDGDRIATGVSAALGPGDLHPRLFTIGVTPRAPHTLAEVEAAIRDELRALARTPPTDGEVGRVRVQIEAGRVRRLRSSLGLAFQLAASASALGDWRATFAFSERMAEVTPDDIQRVVARHFRDDLLTAVHLARPATPDDDGGVP